MFTGSALALAAAVLAIVFLTGSGGGQDERGAPPGRRLHASELPGAGQRGRLPRRADAGHEAEVELLVAHERAALRPDRNWGSYDEEVPLVQTTHNLEYGGAIIYYGPTSPMTRSQH